MVLRRQVVLSWVPVAAEESLPSVLFCFMKLKGNISSHEVEQLPDVEEPVLLRVSGEGDVLGDDGREVISHELGAVIPVPQATAELGLHVPEVLDEGSAPLAGGGPPGVRVVCLQPGDTVVYQVVFLQIFRHRERRVAGGELFHKLRVVQVFPLENVLVGQKPLRHLSLLYESILEGGPGGYGLEVLVEVRCLAAVVVEEADSC